MEQRTKIILRTLLAVAAGGALLYLAFGRPDRRPSEPVQVFCAAGAKTPVLRLARRFTDKTGERIELRYGGSGDLLRDITETRAGDLFIATDLSFINMAAGKGLTGDTALLASHRPVIAVQKSNPKNIRFPDDLLKPLLRVALGDPEQTAIGRQSRNLLFDLGLWDAVEKQVRDRGAFFEAAPEIASAVDGGSADAGIVWSSVAAQYPDIAIVRISAAEAGPPAVTAAAVLVNGRRSDGAVRFMQYLQSEAGRAEFRRAGFDAVPAAPASQP